MSEEKTGSEEAYRRMSERWEKLVDWGIRGIMAGVIVWGVSHEQRITSIESSRFTDRDWSQARASLNAAIEAHAHLPSHQASGKQLELQEMRLARIEAKLDRVIELLPRGGD